MSRTREKLQEILNSIIENLESGKVVWQANWLDQHINGLTYKGYRGINTLLLSRSMRNNNYDVPVWFTFLQVNKLGGKVKKGEKSVEILFFSRQEIKDRHEKKNDDRNKESQLDENTIETLDESSFLEEMQNEDENVQSNKPKKYYWVAKTYYVFNINQVEGIDKEKYAGLQFSERKSAEYYVDLARKMGVNIVFRGISPCYIPSQDIIEMVSPKLCDSVESYYYTLFHEIIHSTGKEGRMNRFTEEAYHKEKYAFEELVAEIGATILMNKAGLDINNALLDNSVAYLSHWIKYLKESHYTTFFKAVSVAEKSVAFLESYATQEVADVA